VVGVAGGYCAGKNVVVELLRARGFLEIDVDRVGHEVLELPEARGQLLRRFGGGILGPSGAVDRQALGRRVFASRRELRGLEAIVHPLMAERVRARVQAASGPVVINAAVLFRMGLDRLCDLVICVRAGLLRRLWRARRRDGSGLFRALRRIASQRGICPKSHGTGVDTYYVENNRTREALQARVLALLQRKGVGTS
jgi:dephospho-CoA kinase